MDPTKTPAALSWVMPSAEPALVLLPGLGDPAAWWFTVPSGEGARPHWQGNTRAGEPGIAAALALSVRVIAHDRAGVGNSPEPDHDRGWPELYAELEAVVQAAQLACPPVLIGHSLGGLIAYSSGRPDRLQLCQAASGQAERAGAARSDAAPAGPETAWADAGAPGPDAFRA